LPLARDAPHWRSEAHRVRFDAMRQRIDITDLYAKALRIMPEQMGAR
jgi:hypothetical protein